MIAEIPASTFEIPQYALWMLGGWILTTLIAGWSGYLWGLRSQNAAEKLKSKNAALASIDSILFEIPKLATLPDLFTKTREDLRKSTLGFSSQLNATKRLITEKALNDYQTLKITERVNLADVLNRIYKPFDKNKIQEERKAMLDALNHLRGVIVDA